MCINECLFEPKPVCLDEKILKKGEVAVFHSCCSKLAHSQYSHLVQAYGL